MDLSVQKATAFEKLKDKDFDTKKWMVSKKYDGHCILIYKDQDGCPAFKTSGGKDFRLPLTEMFLSKVNFSKPMVAEFMYDCDGRLGSRNKSAILTTLRTCYAKNQPLPDDFDERRAKIRIFDMIDLELTALERRKQLVEMFNEAELTLLDIKPVDAVYVTGVEARMIAMEKVEHGWEGLMCLDPDSLYVQGKRVKHAVKLKFRQTADLVCIGVEEGQGKCQGIGALILQDKQGRVVKVGSGLNYDESTRQGDFIGKTVEISFERIDKTYIQPVFVGIKEDI